MRAFLLFMLILSIGVYLVSDRDVVAPYWNKVSAEVNATVQKSERLRSVLRSPGVPPQAPAKSAPRVIVIDSREVASAMSIDFMEGTIDGRRFYDYTGDQITAMLGPPTWIRETKDKAGIEYVATHVKYHWVGLDFWFHHEAVDSEEHCYELSARTRSMWDHEAKLEYGSYPGSFAQGVSGDWNARAVVNEILMPDVPSNNDALIAALGEEHSMMFDNHTVTFAYERDSGSLKTIRMIHHSSSTM
jgi:hypothetical protein